MEGWWLGWDVGVLMYGNEQKVGFAEKKLRLTQKNGVSCVSRVACPYRWWLATTDPRLSYLAMGGFIFVARHKSGESYPFLNERAASVG